MALDVAGIGIIVIHVPAGNDVGRQIRMGAVDAGVDNGDGVNSFNDFRLFEADYDAANGAGSLAAAVGVPEPSGVCLTLLALAIAAIGRRRC